VAKSFMDKPKGLNSWNKNCQHELMNKQKVLNNVRNNKNIAKTKRTRKNRVADGGDWKNKTIANNDGRRI
jgi:hypothetical protein